MARVSAPPVQPPPRPTLTPRRRAASARLSQGQAEGALAAVNAAPPTLPGTNAPAAAAESGGVLLSGLRRAVVLEAVNRGLIRSSDSSSFSPPPSTTTVGTPSPRFESRPRSLFRVEKLACIPFHRDTRCAPRSSRQPYWAGCSRPDRVRRCSRCRHNCRGHKGQECRQCIAILVYVSLLQAKEEARPGRPSDSCCGHLQDADAISATRSQTGKAEPREQKRSSNGLPYRRCWHPVLTSLSQDHAGRVHIVFDTAELGTAEVQADRTASEAEKVDLEEPLPTTRDSSVCNWTGRN